MACSTFEEEKNCKLTYFFRDLLKRRIDFQIPSSETKDIIFAVDTLVGMLVSKVTSNAPCLRSFARLVKVGSMAERTSIKFPNEFDYIVVSEQEDVKVERTCKWREGYAHVKVINPKLQWEWKHFLRGDYLPGSFKRDFFPAVKLAEFFQYLCSVGKKWLHRNPRVDERTGDLWCPYYDSLENAFMIEVHRVLKNSNEDLICVTDSGTLRADKLVANHGPAFMPKLIWTRNHRNEKVEITVDNTTAIGVQFSPDHPIIYERDTFHPKIWEKLVQHGKYMLIPCHESIACAAGLCFRLTFTETEVELVRSLSHHHKECYKLLKYIFNGGGGLSFVPSYVLKTLVIKHDCFCRETANLATCFKTLVASILYHIFDKKTEEKIEPSRLIRLYIPGEKFSLNIPSIFIVGHNILDSKDYKIPCELFLLAIEEMLESLEKISVQDNPDDKELKLVNHHRTAALAYGSSMFPYVKNSWEVVHCTKCFERYFRRYGARK